MNGCAGKVKTITLSNNEFSLLLESLDEMRSHMITMQRKALVNKDKDIEDAFFEKEKSVEALKEKLLKL